MDVTGGNTVLPNRPVLGIALDAAAPNATLATGYAAVGGFNANTPATPGHVFQVTCTANCATFTWANKTGNLPDIPVDSIIVNHNIPQQVFAGTDWGVYYTDDVTVASPTWFRFEDGMAHSMVWDLQIDRGATTLSAWTRGRGAYVYAARWGRAATTSATTAATTATTSASTPACSASTTPATSGSAATASASTSAATSAATPAGSGTLSGPEGGRTEARCGQDADPQGHCSVGRIRRARSRRCRGRA